MLRWSARVPAPPIRWRATHAEPWFDNMVGTLRLDGDEASITFERVGGSDDGEPLSLEAVYERGL